MKLFNTLKNSLLKRNSNESSIYEKSLNEITKLVSTSKHHKKQNTDLSMKSTQARPAQPIQSKPINIYRIVVDVETTGLNSYSDEILQLSICNGEGEPIWDQLYKPLHKSEWYEASAVNLIFPSSVEDSPFLYQDRQIIQNIFYRSSEIVFYNAKFDVSFLEGAGFSIEKDKIIDAMTEYAGLCSSLGKGGKWRKLQVAARETGYDMFKAHDALEDVRATAHVLRWVESKRQAISCQNE